MGSWSPYSAQLHSTPAPPDFPAFWQELCFTPRHSLCEARGRPMAESTGTSPLREAEMLQPASFPSTAHPAAQRLPAWSWLSEGARHHWKLGPGSSSKGKTRTRVLSAQELLLCGAVERSFPEQGNAATQPKAGMRGRSRESRRKLAEPSSARSLRSLVPWLLQPSPRQHLYPGPAATAADSCCHATRCPQSNGDLGRDELSPESLPSCYRPGCHSFLSVCPALTARSKSCKPRR